MNDEQRARYERAAHAMQSGVAMMMNYDPGPTNPKHLRVGVNSAMVEHSALGHLLIEKGLITEDEYVEAIIIFMEREVKTYERLLKEILGTEVHLR